ncbi:hypothetical protein EJ110_NYTH31474 [Nymphaea thermarum]|nr:hypothetical protein EJ110_NYTH31474 [Nymphaea thermarum]
MDWVVAHVLISPISSDSRRSWVFQSLVGLNRRYDSFVYRHSRRDHETIDFLQLAAISSGAIPIQHWNREWNWNGEPPPLSQLRVKDLLQIQEVCHTDVFSYAYATDVQADTIVSTNAFAWSNALHSAATCGWRINPIWVGPRSPTGAPGQKSIPPSLPLCDAAEGHRWSHWDWKGLQPLNSSPIYDVVPRSRRAETGRMGKDSDLKEAARGQAELLLPDGNFPHIAINVFMSHDLLTLH